MPCTSLSQRIMWKAHRIRNEFPESSSLRWRSRLVAWSWRSTNCRPTSCFRCSWAERGGTESSKKSRTADGRAGRYSSLSKSESRYIETEEDYCKLKNNEIWSREGNDTYEKGRHRVHDQFVSSFSANGIGYDQYTKRKRTIKVQHLLGILWQQGQPNQEQVQLWNMSLWELNTREPQRRVPVMPHKCVNHMK